MTASPLVAQSIHVAKPDALDQPAWQGPVTDPTAGLLAALPPGITPGPGGQVLTVGVGEEFSTLAAAIAASHDGDVIAVAAGTYTNDFATITTKIAIVGVGGMVNLVATEPPPNLKGILTVDNDVTIQNLAFSGCAIPDSQGGNGAGIRYEGGQMVLENCSFSGNQDGILAFPVIPQLTVNTISIDHCVFSANGSGSGYTHNLYVGAVDKLTATNSVFEYADVGHEFKSRALVNDISGNVFRDGTATASYDIDLPNGGVDTVTGNVIEKGPNAENDAMIHFGGEGIPYAGSSLTISGNSFVADNPNAIGVLNQTAISVAIAGNSFTSMAPAQILSGPGSETSDTDGQGNPLPDSTLIGALPGSTLIITDDQPHTVILTGTLQAVEGGGGYLTVTAEIGHVIAIGGSGGMTYVEAANGGGSSIQTAAGSVNSITLTGQDLLNSQGTDAIVTGGGNVTGQVSGHAIISDGTGNNQWAVSGTAVITGHGSNPVVSVGPQGSATIVGPLGYLAVSNNGGQASFDIVQGGAEQVMSMSGGAVYVRVYSASMNVSTAAASQGSVLRFGAGTALVTSLGADTIYAGSGSDTIIVSGQATIYAGTGALAVFGRGDSMGATVYGNGGDYVLDGDTGNITYEGGAKASTVELRLSNNTLIGGAGRLTINGGSRETITGGSGGIVYAATDGGGADTITTAVGSSNRLTLAGADVIDSWGNDTIHAGAGNQSLTVHGDATITGGTGNSTVTLSGRDTLSGSGENSVTVTKGAHATVTAGRNTTIAETAATVSLFAGGNIGVVVTGGAASLSGSNGGSLAVTTAAGVATKVALYGGTIAVTSAGHDTLHAGSGTDTIAITAANTQVWGGSGALTVHDADWTAGDAVSVHGGSGSLRYDQGPGALTFVGGSGSAVIDGGWGSLKVTGGAGALSISGGSQAMRFIAGTGNATVTVSPGGGELTFGRGHTAVQVAGWGAAEKFDFVAGHGGGVDTITSFRGGIDVLSLQGGLGVASQQSAGGTTGLTLTDGTQVNLVGLINPAQLFG